MSAVRQPLLNRRTSDNFSFECEGQFFVATVSRFSDGRLAEILLGCPKPGSALAAHAQNSAILVSLLLQYGAPVENIQHSLLGPIAAALEQISRRQNFFDIAREVRNETAPRTTASPQGRRRLTDRRFCEGFDFELDGLKYKATISRFADGDLGEVFVSNHKAGNASDIAARDAGILVSLCLQHGCDVATIARAVSRNSDGAASGVIGAVLDKILAGDRS